MGMIKVKKKNAHKKKIPKKTKTKEKKTEDTTNHIITSEKEDDG